MKKFLTPFFIALMAIGFTGCGDSQPAPNVETENIKMGMLKNLNATEQKYEEIMQKFENNANIKLAHHQVIFYDNLSTMKSDIESGKIQEISTYTFLIDYLMGKDSRYQMAKNHFGKKKQLDNFAFAIRAEDTALKISINAVLEDMQNSKELDRIQNTYINRLDYIADPPAVAFEKFDGADTIKVGVTGDLPPMDLILADGTPAGFNTALISEIGKRLQKNIEIVKIDSASRAEALTSRKIDIAFWAIIPINAQDENLADIDMPNGVELTAPYFQDEVAHIEFNQ